MTSVWRTAKANALPLLVVALFLSALAFSANHFLDLTQPKRVLLIGDFNSNHGFARPVQQGMWRAKNRLPGISDLQIVKVPISDSEQISQHDLAGATCKALIAEFAKGRPIAVVAATTTAATQTVREICNAFQVPLVITVATNDSLMPQSQFADSPDRIRLIANDSRQALTIATYVEASRPDSLSEGDKRMHSLENVTQPMLIVYEDGPYSRHLFDLISATLSTHHVRWEALRQTAYSDDLSARLRAADIRLGYFETFKPLLDNLTNILWRGEVVMSDGCLTSGLFEYSRTRFGIQLSVPVTVPSNGKQIPEPLQGFEQYGYDAYVLLALCPLDARHRLPSVAALNDVSLTVPPAIDEFNVVLDGRGENTLADFRVLPLSSVKSP